MSYQLIVLGNAFVVRWERPEMADLVQVRGSLQERRVQVGTPLIYFAVVPEGAEPPPDDVRERMMKTMGEVLEHCDQMYFVIEGTGFKHSVARSALSGILLVSGKRGRVFVHTSMDEAVRRASTLTGVTPRALIEAVQGKAAARS